VEVPYHWQRHDQYHEIGDNPRYGWYDGEKLLVTAMSGDCRVPIVRNGDADQGVCEDGADPPEQHYNSYDLRYEAKCWGDKDAVEKH